jgi:hypothetical protein
MAYVLDIPANHCQRRSCVSAAKVEVRNHWNATVGRYCRAHGRAVLAEQQRAERENFPAMDRSWNGRASSYYGKDDAGNPLPAEASRDAVRGEGL